MQRLDKFLSDSNIASRRELRQIIRAGRVRVGERVVREPEYKVDEKVDEIFVDGERVGGIGRIVLMLNKPAGVVTSTSDPRDRTVMELLPPQYRTLVPVGRLDKDTEGLLLFTNDGQLAHRLISPRHGVEKCYYAEHEGTADEQDIVAFRNGVELRDGTKCLPARLEPLGPGKSRVFVCEGKYHQVRRMLASRGKPVTYLRRIAEGGLKLDNLPLGEIRELTNDEVMRLDSVHFDEVPEDRK